MAKWCSNWKALYLNMSVPPLQIIVGVLGFIRRHRGHKVAPRNGELITRAFVDAIERFVADNDVPVVNFEKGQCKGEVAAQFCATYQAEEGVLFGVRRRRSTGFTVRNGGICVPGPAMPGS